MDPRDWIWDHTPSYRRTTSFGKRWITVGSRLWQKYGATRWANLDELTDKQVARIKEAYELQRISDKCSQDGEH